jgi:hypothetical protein
MPARQFKYGGGTTDPWVTFADVPDGENRPDAYLADILRVNNSAPTNINLLNDFLMEEGETVLVWVLDANTTFINGSGTAEFLHLQGGIDFAAPAGTMLTFMLSGGEWYEINRASAGDGPSPARSVLLSLFASSIDTVNDRFLVGAGAGNTTEIQYVVPRDGALRGLHVRHNAANGNGVDVRYTVRVDGVDTALDLLLATGVTGEANITGVVAVTAGQLVSVRASPVADIVSGALGTTVIVEFS